MRYFFDLHDNGLKYDDDIGIDLQNFSQARAEAVRLLTEMIRDLDPIVTTREVAVEVCEPRGRRLMRASLKLDVDQP